MLSFTIYKIETKKTNNREYQINIHPNYITFTFVQVTSTNCNLQNRNQII